MAAGMTGDWSGMARMLGAIGSPQVWKQAKKRAALKEAHRLRGIMIKSFNAGGPPGKKWKSLSTFTQLVSRALGKGDRRPLMDSGDMRNSHTVVDKDETVFVGVHRTESKPRKSGSKKMNPVDIASIHEFGTKPIYIRVTERMRNFFKYVLFPKTGGQIKPLRQSTIAIIVRIPARPWIFPIWESEQDQSAKNIMEDTIRNLNVPGLSSILG